MLNNHTEAVQMSDAGKRTETRDVETSQRLSTYKTCPVCGQPFLDTKTTGRPRVFCGDDCRRLDQMFGWMEDQLQRVSPTADKKKAMRRKLWYLANLLNANNRSGHGKGKDGE